MYKIVVSCIVSFFMLAFAFNASVDKNYFDNSDYLKAEDISKEEK